MSQPATEAEPSELEAELAALAEEHQQTQAEFSALTVLTILALWAQLAPNAPLLSWLTGLGPKVYVILSTAQEFVAAMARAYVADASDIQDLDVAVPVIDPLAFAGRSADGTSLVDKLDEIAARAEFYRRQGVQARVVKEVGATQLERLVRTEIADAAREADQVAIVGTRKMRRGRRGEPRIPGGPANLGYIRVLELPSCARCIVLAGKWYGWNAGFERHENCDCKHLPITRDNQENLHLWDPRRIFDSLTEEEQDRTFTKADAQAIRDGADMSQVVKAKEGLSYAGIQGRQITSVGTTRRGFYGSQTEKGRAGFERLTPQVIYREAKGDREKAIQGLIDYGYIIGDV